MNGARTCSRRTAHNPQLRGVSSQPYVGPEPVKGARAQRGVPFRPWSQGRSLRLVGAEAPRRETGFPCGDHSRKAGCPRFFRQPMRGGGPAWFCHAGRTRLTEGQAGLPRRRELTASGSRRPTPRRGIGEHASNPAPRRSRRTALAPGVGFLTGLPLRRPTGFASRAAWGTLPACGFAAPLVPR